MNNKVKILIVAGAAALTIGVGAGVVAAQMDDPIGGTSGTCPMHTAEMDEMHSQMPAEMQARHAQMGGTGMGGMNMHGDGMNMHGTSD